MYNDINYTLSLNLAKKIEFIEDDTLVEIVKIKKSIPEFLLCNYESWKFSK